MLIDTHIHVGQYNEYYFSPATIHELMEQCKVDYYAVSSTTQCVELYNKVVEEIECLIALDEDKVLPTMWITPEGLKGNIAWYLESNIKWRLLKIHPFLNKNEWNPNKKLIYEVIDIARELKVPILIHTGEDPSCNSQLFEPIISSESDIIFILAHGRPQQEAIELSINYANAYVDSAFMPVADMKAFIDAGLENKLLWGTDMCIPKYFQPEMDFGIYYKEKLLSLNKVCTTGQFQHITYLNALNVLGIKGRME